jgi:hypothetical protein
LIIKKLLKRKLSKMVDRRLKEWGLWFVRSVVGGLGAPSQSTLVTALQGSRSTAPFYPKDNTYAEEVNDILNSMRKRHPGWANVVSVEYTSVGTQKIKAKNTGMSLTIYKNTLDSARAWVDARLS